MRESTTTMSGEGEFWCDGPDRLHVTGLVRALIETKWRVFIAHQGDVAEDAVQPAVDAQQQVEEGAGVLPSDQHKEARYNDEQVEDRVATDGLDAGAPVVAGPRVREKIRDDEADDDQMRDGQQPLNQDQAAGEAFGIGDVKVGWVVGSDQVDGG